MFIYTYRSRSPSCPGVSHLSAASASSVPWRTPEAPAAAPSVPADHPRSPLMLMGPVTPAAPLLLALPLVAARRPQRSRSEEAVDVVKQMKAAELLAKNARPSPNVVACAIALWRGEPFADDRSALRLFGAHPETKVRKMASAIHASVHRPHQMTKWSMHMMTIRLESRPSCTVCVGSA